MSSKKDLVRRRGANRSQLLGAVSLLALSAATPVWAADATEGTELPTVMVTAQFRSQSLQTTPLAITAMTGEELLQRGYTDVSQIGSLAPNVTIAAGSAAYGNSATVYIRGIGQYDTNFALEPGVGMYVDDVYHGVLTGSLFDLLDLDRVEILRGPQGTLAGKNSIGGAVKLYSVKPKGDGHGYLQATYGGLNQIGIRGAFDQSIVPDELFLRVSGYSKRRDGYVDRLDFACDRPSLAGALPSNRVGTDCKIGSMGGVRAWGVRANALWLPTDNLEINIIGGIARDDSETAALVQQTANDPSFTYLGVPYDSRFLPIRKYTNYSTFSVPETGWNAEPLNNSHAETISGTIDWKISDSVAFKSITGYENLNTTWVLDTDGSPLGLNLTLDHQPYHQFTQEVRFSGQTANDMLEWTLGGFYFDSRGRVGARVYSAPLLNWIQDDPVDSTSKSVFAHLVFHPVQRVSVIGGIRYTDDKKSYQFVRIDPDTGAPAGIVGILNGQSRTYSGSSWDYRAAVQYEFNDDIMAYGQFSTGYKGGGINPRPFIPSQVVPFNPERVNAFETGVKTDLFDRRMRLNVSAFLNKYRNIILVDANGYPGSPGDPDFFPASAVPFNAGKADIKGIEVETTITPIEGLKIDGSVSYLDFKYKNLDPNATASGIGPGSVPPFTPKWKWAMLASYAIPLPGGGMLTPQFDLSYMDKVFTDPVNAATNTLPSYTLANARISYQSSDQDWEIIFGVTNLTNKYYATNAFDVSAINGTSAFAYQPPREWYITLRRNF